jgi:NAD(P)-dependent dehydrogenase (short-subunit alcohol dehydrogenase family)
MQLTGKRALITGASGDLGRAMVTRFVDAGACVAAHYFSRRELLEPLAEAARARGGDLLMLQADLQRPTEVARLMADVVARWGGLDVLINSAGGARPRPVHELDASEWTQCLELNLTASFLCLKEAVPWLEESRGTVINLSSVAGLTGGAFGLHYATAKAGVIGLTRAAARELGPLGIRVNTVAPGPVASAMTDAVAQDALKNMLAGTALGRVVEPGEVAEAVAWLASGCNAITGQTLVVDGGRYLL